MKLLLCPECHDILALTQISRTCRCGDSRGYYQEDGLVAHAHGKALIMGMENGFLQRVIDLHQYTYTDQNLTLAAWIIAEPGTHVVYHREKE